MARARDVIGFFNRSTWSRSFAVAAFALCSATHETRAQRPQQPPPRSQPEQRADVIDARSTAAHLGVGFSVPAGTYVRLGVVGAMGQAWRSGEPSTAGRVDGLVRFVVDPLREFRWAPYGAGGIGAIYDGTEKWRAVLVGAVGIEGPASGAVVPAVEIGFGGGARVGVAIRRAMRGRR